MTDPAAVRAALAAYLNVPVAFVCTDEAKRSLWAMTRAISAYQFESRRLASISGKRLPDEAPPIGS